MNFAISLLLVLSSVPNAAVESNWKLTKCDSLKTDSTRLITNEYKRENQHRISSNYRFTGMAGDTTTYDVDILVTTKNDSISKITTTKNHIHSMKPKTEMTEFSSDTSISSYLGNSMVSRGFSINKSLGNFVYKDMSWDPTAQRVDTTIWNDTIISSQGHVFVNNSIGEKLHYYQIGLSFAGRSPNNAIKYDVSIAKGNVDLTKTYQNNETRKTTCYIMTKDCDPSKIVR